MNCVFDLGQMVCVKLNDDIEEFLVGYLEAEDEEGIIILNINYKGTATGHVYLSSKKIHGFLDERNYMDKLKELCGIADGQRQFQKFAGENGVLNEILIWAYKNNKEIKITYEDEQIQGYIDELENEWVLIKLVDSVTGQQDGYSMILKSMIDDLVAA